MNDPNRWKFTGDTYYVMSREEIEASFKRNGHEVLDQKVVELAIDTSVEIADKCNVNLRWDQHFLPKVPVPSDPIYENKIKKAKIKNPEFNPNSETFLKHICQEGLKNKNKTSKDYLDRLNYELSVINDMGFPDYFLIVWDIMKFCHDNDIPVGPARGCASRDEKVQLADGTIKKIQDVSIGDMVIGHDEIPRKVIDTLQYDCNEELVTLEVESNKSLTMTKDHKVYAIKKEDFEKGIREPQWYAMDDLDEGDYMCELE